MCVRAAQGTSVCACDWANVLAACAHSCDGAVCVYKQAGLFLCVHTWLCMPMLNSVHSGTVSGRVGDVVCAPLWAPVRVGVSVHLCAGRARVYVYMHKAYASGCASVS